MKRFPSLCVCPAQGTTPRSVQEAMAVEEQAARLCGGAIIEDLIELAYGDMRVAHSIWVEYFPRAWLTFSRDEQLRLAQALMRFLASDIPFAQRGVSTHPMWEEVDRDYKQWGATPALPFTAQARSRYGSLPCTNGVQTLLEGVLRCEPQPRLAPVLLLNLAKTYGCAPQASLLLESGLRECEPDERPVYQRCLRQVYLELKEEDAAAAMVTALPYPELHNGMVLERFGRFQTAQVAYLEGLRNQEVVNSAEALTTVKERWKECALNLRQWVPLFEFAKLNRDLWLLLECYSKSNIWECACAGRLTHSNFQSILFNPSCMAERDLNLLRWELNSEYYNTMHLLQDRSARRRSRLGELLISAYRAVVCQPVRQYDGILHTAYQLSNIQTSAQLLQLLQASQGPVDARVAPLVKSFGECLMNENDPLALWNDIEVWRAHFSGELLRYAPQNQPLPLLSPSLPLLTIARAARQQGLPLVAAEYLRMLPTSLNAYESFDRWKEQALITLELTPQNRGVLAEAEGLRVESMKEIQRSAVQHVYGLYALKEKKVEEAAGFFSKAVHLDGKNRKALESLSQLLYAQWKELRTPSSAQQCLNCLFQQFLLKVDAAKVMPRFLHVAVASLDNHQLAELIAANAARIPLLSWLPYLPFLFARPSKAVFTAFTPVITGLIKKMPQTVFFPLRVLCLSLGMPNASLYASHAVVPPSTVLSHTPTPAASTVDLTSVHVQYFILLSTLSKSISQLLLLADTLEGVPHYSFCELLAGIDAVLAAAYNEIATVGFVSFSQPVSPALQARLDALCAQFFDPAAAVPSTLHFVRQYAQPFLRDFASLLDGKPNPALPKSLHELLQRLLLWKRVALARIDEGEKVDVFEKLISYSRFIPGSLEVPGQSPLHSLSIAHATIQSIHLHRPLLYQERHACRHVDMIAEQNRVFRFYLERLNDVDLALEEHAVFLQSFVASLQPPKASQIVMQTSLPVCLPVTPSLRLVRGLQFGTSLEGVFRTVLGEAFDEKQSDFALRLFVLNHPQAAVPPEFAAWRAEVKKETLFDVVCDEAMLKRFVWVLEC